MLKKLFIIVYIIMGSWSLSNAQVSPSHTQFFINPYRLNPSYAGIEGTPVMYLVHRQQWMGIEGAPVTTSFSFHAPLNYGVSFGADIYSDQRSILNTNSFLLTAGYTISFSKKDYLRFGLSGGLGFRNIDLSQVDNPSDPALVDVVDNNLFLNGNFGISFHSGYFSFGVAMPNLFGPNLNNTTMFENGPIAPLNEIIVNTSYRLYFGMDELDFEPHLLYRYSDVQPHQYEAAGIFHLKHLVWIGGSFRQDYGVSGLAGVKINNRILIGYSYSLGLASLPGIGKSTHEFNLSMQLGKQRQPLSSVQDVKLSFIDTERDYWDLSKGRRTVTTRRTTTREEPEDEEEEEEEVESDTLETTQTRETVQTHDNPRLSLAGELSSRRVEDVPLEIVEGRDHRLELPGGNYVIVREFENQATAQQYSDRLEQRGERSGHGYVSDKNKWVVYVYRSDSKIGLRRMAEKIRSESDYSGAKILIVE